MASFLKKLKDLNQPKHVLKKRIKDGRPAKPTIPEGYKEWDKLESKFKSWEHFFSTKREGMVKLGIRSCKVRKYLLNWMEKYRQGVDPGLLPFLLSNPVAKRLFLFMLVIHTGTCKYNLYYKRFY